MSLEHGTAAAGQVLAQLDAALGQNPADALCMAQQAIDVCHQSGNVPDPALLGELYCRLGQCRVVLGDGASLEAFEAALEYAEHSGSLALKADGLHGLARRFIACGEYDNALQYCEYAIALGRELHDTQKLVQIFMTLALVFAYTHQYARALPVCRETVATCLGNQDNAGLARACNNQAAVMLAQGAALEELGHAPDARLLDEATSYARQALGLAGAAGLPRLALLASTTLAHALERRGLYAQGLAALADAGALCGRGFAKEETDLMLRNGALFMKTGQHDLAIRWLEQAHAAAARNRYYPHLPELLHLLSDAYEAAGDVAAALRTYKALHAAWRSEAALQQPARQRQAEARPEPAGAQPPAALALTHPGDLEPPELPGRRELEHHLRGVLAEAPAASFAMAEVDLLAHYGEVHHAGDAILHTIRTLMHAGQDSHWLARISRSEFALVLRHEAGRKPFDLCERVRRAVEMYDWEGLTPGLQITLSMGLTEIRHGDDFSSLMSRADQALAKARRNGRNRTERI